MVVGWPRGSARWAHTAPDDREPTPGERPGGRTRSGRRRRRGAGPRRDVLADRAGGPVRGVRRRRRLLRRPQEGGAGGAAAGALHRLGLRPPHPDGPAQPGAGAGRPARPGAGGRRSGTTRGWRSASSSGTWGWWSRCAAGEPIAAARLRRAPDRLEFFGRPPPPGRRRAPPEDRGHRRLPGLRRRHRRHRRPLGHLRAPRPARAPAPAPLAAAHRALARRDEPGVRAGGPCPRRPGPRAVGERHRQPAGAGARTQAPCWPEGVEPLLTDVDVAISRTRPEHGGTELVHEIELLWLAAIAAAREHRLHREPVLRQPPDRRGDRRTAAARTTARSSSSSTRSRPTAGWRRRRWAPRGPGCSTSSAEADVHDRFRMYVPVTDGGQPVYVHAKVTGASTTGCCGSAARTSTTGRWAWTPSAT